MLSGKTDRHLNRGETTKVKLREEKQLRHSTNEAFGRGKGESEKRMKKGQRGKRGSQKGISASGK